jgi:hypothetical protein
MTDRSVIKTALVLHDPYDQFAWVQGWRFAIAQYLTDQGEYVPEFRGADDIREDSEYAELTATTPTVEALWYADTVLGRFRNLLRLAGKDY